MHYFSSNLLSITNKSLVYSPRESLYCMQTFFTSDTCLGLAKWQLDECCFLKSGGTNTTWIRNSKSLVSSVTQMLADGEWRTSFGGEGKDSYSLFPGIICLSSNHYKTLPWRKNRSSAVEEPDDDLMSEKAPASCK